MDGTAKALSDQLRQTFETVAKIAMQAAARSDDPAVTVGEKIQRAHSDITLIMDDAMRGMNEAIQWLLCHAILAEREMLRERQKDEEGELGPDTETR